jgi:hypothetical protein
MNEIASSDAYSHHGVVKRSVNASANEVGKSYADETLNSSHGIATLLCPTNDCAGSPS